MPRLVPAARVLLLATLLAGYGPATGRTVFSALAEEYDRDVDAFEAIGGTR